MELGLDALHREIRRGCELLLFAVNGCGSGVRGLLINLMGRLFGGTGIVMDPSVTMMSDVHSYKVRVFP